MLIENKVEYSDFNDLVNYYNNFGDIGDIHILACPSDVEVTSVRFVTNEYTMSVWATPNKVTLKEMGFRLLPDTVIEMANIKSMEYDDNHIEIWLKKSNVKRIFIDFKDFSKSFIK